MPPEQPRIVRNLDTPESREFWKSIEECAKEVDRWAWWQFGDKARCRKIKGTLRRAFRCELAEGHRCRCRYVRAQKVTVE